VDIGVPNFGLKILEVKLIKYNLILNISNKMYVHNNCLSLLAKNVKIVYRVCFILETEITEISLDILCYF